VRFLFYAAVKPWDPDVTDKLVLHDEGNETYIHHKLAAALAEHRQWKPELNIKPGYILFVGLLYRIFGESPWIVLLFQVLIDTASCIFLFVTIAKLLNSKVALYSSIFYIPFSYFAK